MKHSAVCLVVTRVPPCSQRTPPPPSFPFCNADRIPRANYLRPDASDLGSPHFAAVTGLYTKKCCLNYTRSSLCGRKRDANHGLRGDWHWVGFVTTLSGYKLLETEGEEVCWEVVCRVHVAENSLHFRKSVFNNYNKNRTL